MQNQSMHLPENTMLNPILSAFGGSLILLLIAAWWVLRG